MATKANSVDMLIIGGSDDFNIKYLYERARQLGIDAIPQIFTVQNRPRISYDVLNNSFTINDIPIQARSAFIRPHMHLANNEKKIADYKISSEWFSIYMGWILSNKDILVFNRRFFTGNTVNKLFTLRRALEVGFEVPETYYTNDINFITQKTLKNDFIQKPVDGGDHTKEISELTENVKQDQESLNRAITFQEKLETPEMRIFRVGNQQLAFDLYCDDLDYRVQQNAKLEYRGENIPEDLAKMNFELTEALGLEFAATDLKVCSKTGGYKILEVNSGPMFKGFDQVANGKLTSAILENLLL